MSHLVAPMSLVVFEFMSGLIGTRYHIGNHIRTERADSVSNIVTFSWVIGFIAVRDNRHRLMRTVCSDDTASVLKAFDSTGTDHSTTVMYLASKKVIVDQNFISPFKLLPICAIVYLTARFICIA